MISAILKVADLRTVLDLVYTHLPSLMYCIQMMSSILRAGDILTRCTSTNSSKASLALIIIIIINYIDIRLLGITGRAADGLQSGQAVGSAIRTRGERTARKYCPALSRTYVLPMHYYSTSNKTSYLSFLTYS